ncbi:hypothetical protein ACFQL1_21450 [Halomicroarcula sp. GCM10025709]|uniref:hypothetical protein n=1 Tax=Halomicroarcula sp. GCM10025709 TaxID=3252669 RepID=UPI00361BE872
MLPEPFEEPWRPVELGRVVERSVRRGDGLLQVDRLHFDRPVDLLECTPGVPLVEQSEESEFLVHREVPAEFVSPVGDPVEVGRDRLLTLGVDLDDPQLVGTVEPARRVTKEVPQRRVL